MYAEGMVTHTVLRPLRFSGETLPGDLTAKPQPVGVSSHQLSPDHCWPPKVFLFSLCSLLDRRPCALPWCFHTRVLSSFAGHPSQKFASPCTCPAGALDVVGSSLSSRSVITLVHSYQLGRHNKMTCMLGLGLCFFNMHLVTSEIEHLSTNGLFIASALRSRWLAICFLSI